MTKALIYCRVSSQRQVQEGHGIDSQEQRCNIYAKNKNYDVAAVFPDEGISGGLFERPAMKSLIAYLDKHPTEQYVVIFDDLARFARDVKVHIQLKAELVSRGAKLECLNFNYDESDESEMAELMLAVSNQYQRKANRRQVIQKMKARLERGYWPFMPPTAMVNKKDPVHGKILTSKEPYASIYKKVIEKYRDGILITQEEVMFALHDEYKINNLPNKPSMSTTQHMLKNPLYAGYIEYKDWDIPFKKAQHEGFLSIETFNIVQKRLGERTKPWKRRDYSDMFPLRPHVLCDACNKPMTASYCTGRKGIRYPHYFCRNKGCIYNWKTTAKDKFESKFEELLARVKPPADIIDLTKDVLKEQWDIRLEEYTERRNKIMTDVSESDAAIQTYLERIRKTHDEDLIATYEEEIKQLKKRKKESEGELSKRKYTSGEFGTATEKVFNTLKEPVSMWKSEEYNDKRTILFMYFENQLRYDYKTGFGTAGLAYPIKLINEVSASKNSSVEMSESDSESKKVK